MHSGTIWNVKYQDSILNKIISCGYNDAWFVTPKSQQSWKLQQSWKKRMKKRYVTIIWELIKHDGLDAFAL